MLRIIKCRMYDMAFYIFRRLRLQFGDKFSYRIVEDNYNIVLSLIQNFVMMYFALK